MLNIKPEDREGNIDGMMKVEGVILDWAGTVLDYGCFAPVQAFMRVFEDYGIHVTMEETRGPMGMLKFDHIKEMLSMPRIHQEWVRVHGREWELSDVSAMHDKFSERLMGVLHQYTDLKPHVRETIEWLRAMGIKTGSTTGYTNAMMEVVVPEAREKGYEPDCFISPEQVGNMGRPYPYMIFENMKRLKLRDVHKIVKIGDTVSDISEGVNAGVITVGILEGSSEMGLTETEYAAMPEHERKERERSVIERYKAAGADYVIRNMGELGALIGKG